MAVLIEFWAALAVENLPPLLAGLIKQFGQNNGTVGVRRLSAVIAAQTVTNLFSADVLDKHQQRLATASTETRCSVCDGAAARFAAAGGQVLNCNASIFIVWTARSITRSSLGALVITVAPRLDCSVKIPKLRLAATATARWNRGGYGGCGRGGDRGG